MKTSWIWMGALLLAAPLARADGPKSSDDGASSAKSSGPKVTYEKTTVINFDEDDTIEGSLKRPDGEYVEARKMVKHSNLIRIRKDFKKKVMQSEGEL